MSIRQCSLALSQPRVAAAVVACQPEAAELQKRQSVTFTLHQSRAQRESQRLKARTACTACRQAGGRAPLPHILGCSFVAAGLVSRAQARQMASGAVSSSSSGVKE